MSVMGGLSVGLAGVVREGEGVIVGPEPPGGAPPGDPCDFGTWDFTQACQSGHVLTCGF